MKDSNSINSKVLVLVKIQILWLI